AVKSPRSVRISIIACLPLRSALARTHWWWGTVARFVPAPIERAAHGVKLKSGALRKLQLGGYRSRTLFRRSSDGCSRVAGFSRRLAVGGPRRGETHGPKPVPGRR